MGISAYIKCALLGLLSFVEVSLAQPSGLSRLVERKFSGETSVITTVLFDPIADGRAQKHSSGLYRIRQDELKRLYEVKPEAVELLLPTPEGFRSCVLVQHSLLAPDFRLTTATGTEVPYRGGLYYVGQVRDIQGSIVAVSIFAQDIVAVLAEPNRPSLTLARMAASDLYAVYQEQELLPQQYRLFCEVDSISAAPFVSEPTAIRTVNCVRLYYELGYEIFQKCNYDIQATANWMTALHNNLAMVFINDDIHTSISQIYVWDIPDPYQATYSAGQLALFKQHRPQVYGDLGQLLTIEPGHLGGVASTINGFCSLFGKYCYSDVDFEYDAYPLFSWNTFVLLHEWGHLMGSYHTHACVWDSGALDNCGPLAGFPNEGTCPEGPTPLDGGTIMSYCHLTPYGINLTKGFGAQPAAVIRNTINAATCLTTDCAPMPPEYCPSVGNTKDEWIEAVQFNNVVNQSGPGGGYSDFTHLVIYAPPGDQVNYALTPGYLKKVWEENFSVFVDYNSDKDFFDANERVLDILEVTSTVSGSWTVPASAIGETRLRVSMQFEEISEPCDHFNYGEVEDYTIRFAAPLSYCLSKGNDASSTYIDFFGWNNYQRSSTSDGGYYFEAQHVIDVVIGSENTVLYSCASTDKQIKYWKMWIDYNQDGDFDDAGEKIFGRKSKSKGFLARKFTVPASALPGITRVRLSLKTGSSPTSCEVFDEGEVEDFQVNLLPQVGPAVDAATAWFRLYPNPTKSWVVIETEPDAAQSYIEIFDFIGRRYLVSGLMEKVPVTRLSLEYLPAGFYVVRRTTADGQQQVESLMVR
ncbi:MAG: GEVED domain-containing protein [Chitinophagales bacterium]|nr:GEVED domain-containing protein [Chitinophagales bacterium]MDW8427531.1 GEVED domain-containing protein [Chitinophagales bacterium]